MSSQSAGQVPSLQLFVSQLRYYEKIERKIASKQDKLTPSYFEKRLIFFLSLQLFLLQQCKDQPHTVYVLI